MKKFLMGCLVLTMAFLLTGCGDKEKDNLGDKNDKVTNSDKILVCSQKVTGVDVEINTYFKGKAINGMDLKYTMDLSSFADNQIEALAAQDYCTIVKNAMSGFEKAFTNCKQNVSNKLLLITADFDIDKITGLDIEKEGSLEDVKTGMESVGYTCITR